MLQTAFQIHSFSILASLGPLQACLGFRSCADREASFQRTESEIGQNRFCKLLSFHPDKQGVRVHMSAASERLKTGNACMNAVNLKRLSRTYG